MVEGYPKKAQAKIVAIHKEAKTKKVKSSKFIMVSVVRLSETYLILGKKFERAPNPTDFTYVIVPPVCKDFK